MVAAGEWASQKIPSSKQIPYFQPMKLSRIINFCLLLGTFFQLLSVPPSYGENNARRAATLAQGRPPSAVPVLEVLRVSPQPDDIKKRNIDLLLFNGPDGNFSQHQDVTPLMRAAQKGDFNGVRHFLNKGASVNAATDTGVTALMLAAKNGHFEIVKLLYGNGAEINSQSFGPFVNNPLLKRHDAYLNNQLLLPFQIDPAHYDSEKNGFTPLTLAIAWGHKDIADFFISNNADLNLKSFGASPLAVAVYYGQPELAISLINHGIKMKTSKQMVGVQGDLFAESLRRKYWDVASLFLDRGDEDLNSIAPRISGVPLLHYYATYGNTAVIEFLCHKGANPNLIDKNGMSPILYASWSGQQQTVTLLLRLGADINSACLSDKKTMYSSPGSTPLILAILRRHFDLVKFLISRGADIEKGDKQGVTPLVFTLRTTQEDTLGLTKNAAEKKRRDSFHLADFLISHGADINTQDRNGNSALFDATASGSLTVMEYLINKGADVNLANSTGQTPLIIAVTKRNLEKVETLIKSGTVDVNQKDFRGTSPLLLSMKNNDIACGTLLVNHGADVNEVLTNQDTLLTKSIFQNSTEFANLFIEHGANVNAKNKYTGCTPLILSCEKKNLSIIKKLIEHGAEINATDNVGINAFALAKFSGDQNIIHYLKENGADTSVWKGHVLRVKFLQSQGLIPKDKAPDDFDPRDLLFFMTMKNISIY